MSAMELLTSYSTTALLLLLSFFVYKLVALIRQPEVKRQNLPPSPPALPVIGHLHLLGSLPHHSLRNLARKYGPIISLKLGSVHTVVVSDHTLAKEFLKTHDQVFASRPRTMSGKILFDNYKDVAWSAYGPYWRTVRKFCHVELFTPQRLEASKPVRADEILRMVKSMKEEIVDGLHIDVHSHVNMLTRSIMSRMMFNKNCFQSDVQKGKDFCDIVMEAFYLIGAFNVGDFLPFLKPFDLQGFERRMKAVKKRVDLLMEEIIREHEVKLSHERDRPSNDASQDFVDVLLSMSRKDEYKYLKRENFRVLIFDMLSAGTDTSAVTMEWALSEILLQPQIQKKAQEELDRVVGCSRHVSEDDLPNLEYLQCIVKETFRLHPAGPLMLPHESTEPVKVGEYDIPSRTRLLVNVWAVHRDPTVWEQAEEFHPERFLGSHIDVRGQDYQLIPFGSGRRSCPGLNLGLTTVQLGVASLLHSFEWSLEFSELDMSEQFGLTIPRTIPLRAIAKPRLAPHLYS